MSEELSLTEIQKEWHGTYKAYAIGLILCLLLTGVSFYLVWARVLPGYIMIFSLIGLAIVQASIQILFFLHLGSEPKPRWESIVFFFMVLVLFVVVLGSLWIMYDLENRLMPGMDKVL